MSSFFHFRHNETVSKFSILAKNYIFTKYFVHNVQIVEVEVKKISPISEILTLYSNGGAFHWGGNLESKEALSLVSAV